VARLPVIRFAVFTIHAAAAYGLIRTVDGCCLYLLSAFCFQPSAFGFRLSAFGFQLLAFSLQLSAFGFQLSAFSLQPLVYSFAHFRICTFAHFHIELAYKYPL
jgi:hypothetical protein